MNMMRDNLSSNKYTTFITSGSFGEGLEMRGSDLDMMHVCKMFEVYEDVKPRCNPSTVYFSMVTNDVKPCFTQLRLEYSKGEIVFQLCEDHNGNHYFSSALCKRNIFLSTINISKKMHGPCITDEQGMCDLALSVHCKTWISPAVQWITRSRSSWPKNNMFENKIEGRAREVLLEQLYTLQSYGWRCILFSNQISNFRVPIWKFPIEACTFYIKDVEKILQSTIVYYANRSLASPIDFDIFNTELIQKILCQQSSQNHLYKYYLSLLCNEQSQRLPLDSTIRNNKHKYKLYKSCLSTLLTNVYHDAVSGWLMLASLFYKTKQYSKALHIIRYSISKCTPEKLYREMNMSDIHYQSLKLQSIHKEGIVYLLKIMLVDIIQLKVNSTFTTDE
ncbi:unnamed protein product [Mytilus coruscus]|uniref:Mab-21-like HhH/H2TH-like domain-containing protein n=1 Tax=Mytilus coruscus TaxID=42192 RepID=A0A6J8BLB2_MYTCO|nr:unnamed protein product [Mytilus coruscus]